MKLEVAVFNAQSAITALNAGAHRLELCENPQEGGTTPSYGFLSWVKKNIPIPVFPIIRARGGHFVYTKAEKEIMLQDIRLCKELKFEGIVCGALLADGRIDYPFLLEIIELIGNMEITFHRAFDRCRNPEENITTLASHGIKRILTSGQYTNVTDGLQNIEKYITIAKDEIIILPGSGVNSTNVKMLREIGAKEIHASCRKTIQNFSNYYPSTFKENILDILCDEVEVKKILSVIS